MRKLKVEEEINALLRKLKEKEIVEYQTKNNDATLIFNEIRDDERTINRVAKYLENQNNLKKEQFKSVLHYVKEKKACKSRLILSYFGENTIADCGSCSYCITKKVKKEEDNGLSYEILTLLKSEDLNSREIQFKTKKTTDEIIFALQQLLEANKIAIKSNNKYTLLL